MSNDKREKAPTAEEIFGFVDSVPDPEVVPEWGGRTVYIRQISAAAALTLDEKLKALPKERRAEALALILIETLCNENGDPIFAEEHLKQLMSRNAKVLERLQEKALVKLGWKKKDELKNVLSEAPTDASPSDLRVN